MADNRTMRRIFTAMYEPTKEAFEITTLGPYLRPIMVAELREMHFAYLEGVHTLYKFKQFKTAEHERQVRQILIDHTLYFARADTLNDSTEMQVEYRIHGNRTDPATRAIIRKDAEETLRRLNFGISDQAVRRQLELLDSMSLEDMERSAAVLTRLRLLAEFPISCFASRNDQEKHWNEYADNMTGLCIHFEALSRAGSPFAYARRVEYMPAKPKIPIPVSTIDGDDLARRVGLTKHLKYVNEIEYRLVACEGYSAEIKMVDGQHGVFEPQYILGVTVGMNMPPSQKAKVQGMCLKREPAIPVFIATLDAGRIKISPL